MDLLFFSLKAWKPRRLGKGPEKLSYPSEPRGSSAKKQQWSSSIMAVSNGLKERERRSKPLRVGPNMVRLNFFPISIGYGFLHWERIHLKTHGDDSTLWELDLFGLGRKTF